MSDPWEKSRTIQRAGGARETGGVKLATHLFLVLECQRPRGGGARYSLENVDEVLIGRARERIAVRTGRTLRIGVPDPAMSSSHAQLVRALGGWLIRDVGSTNGTFCNGEKITHAEVPDGALLELGASLLTVRTVPTPEGSPLDVDVTPNSPEADLGMATLVPSHAASLSALASILNSTVPVLLLGETGTGKELLARAAHVLSKRAGQFVPVNCGAIPEALVEGQLFGHTRGAFSGAVRDEPGFVRASSGGTLFLDEIGDLPAPSQAALLRVLQESEVLSVGTTRAVKVDLRVVSATHRRIDALTQNGFRGDMYARVAGYVHELPPLRERREDLGILIATILGSMPTPAGPPLTFSVALGRALCEHGWPMNIRELKNALSAALVLAKSDRMLDLAHLPEAIRRMSVPTRPDQPFRSTRPSSPSGPPATTPPSAPPPPFDEENEALRTSLLDSLRQHAGNISEVARTMGRTRMQIHRWMKRFDIDPNTVRDVKTMRPPLPKTEPPPKS